MLPSSALLISPLPSVTLTLRCPTSHTYRVQPHVQVNVAEIDVTTARNIGTRFDVKGFPTILFLRAGKVYKYKGRRVADDLVAFAQGGYADSSIEPTVVPEPMGMMGPFFKVRTIEPQNHHHPQHPFAICVEFMSYCPKCH